MKKLIDFLFGKSQEIKDLEKFIRETQVHIDRIVKNQQ